MKQDRPTHIVTAVIVDHGARPPITSVVAYETSDPMGEGMDRLFDEYALLRGGRRNFRMDDLELKSLVAVRRDA